MAESRIINDIDNYQGIYPTVFKKIDSTDITVNPFQVYKSWVILSGSATSSLLPLEAIYSDPNNLPALGSELTYNDASNIDGSLQTITYYAINHLYYKYKEDPAKTYGPTNLNRTSKFLYQSASVFSVPQIKFGEAIKPQSLSIKTSIGTAKSDRYGNLYSLEIDTSSFVTGAKFYEGFNEYFDTSRTKYVSENVSYVPGVTDIDASVSSVGFAADFSDGGYIKTAIDGNYSRDTDYAIGFYVSGSAFNTTFAGVNQLLVAKISGSTSTQYPFKIEVSGSQDIIFSVRGGTQNVQVKEAVYTTNWQHIHCQKTGSKIELYIDGFLYQSASAAFLTTIHSPLSASARIDNADPLWIGGYGSNLQSLNGCIDELRIYNRALTAAEISSISTRTLSDGLLLQTNHLGNIFTKQGIAVVSTPDYRYHGLTSNLVNFTYNSTITIHELGVIAKLDAGDFNMSTNLTLTKDDDSTYYSFVSSSAFAPYITTIGLYNDAGELLAIGKLAQPIRKRNDVDTNFLIRIDLDKNIR
jgi:hypothetical protein